MLVDSHCHLDFEDFQPDFDAVITRALQAGVTRFLTISTHISKFNRVLETAIRHPAISCTVGIHPHYAAAEEQITVSQLLDLAQHDKVIGLGESGLDYHYLRSPREVQIQQFITHIQASRTSGYPLVIHARDADKDMIQILEEQNEEGRFPFILHCFSSGAELAKVGVRLGGYVSFSGIITFKNSHELREIARQVPLDRLLVETDAPYLSPIPYRGQRCEPAYVRETAQTLAQLNSKSLEDISRQTTTNFNRLFKV